LGAADVNNTYDTNGFLTNVNHSSAVKPSILQLSYSFDAIKNELKSRTTGGDFNIVESFDYDDNNRLVNWTNPVTGIKPSNNRNIYDVKGRIMENDQVGTMKYENSAKIYQPTGMTLNAAGTQNYNNDLIQSIAYNENNDPVFIDGEKGDVAFQYGLTSMRQRVTYGGNFSIDGDGKFTKFYSDDGSFEVLKDNTTGKEKHILYIGGTPYESNIVYLKNFDKSSGSYRFLHKDYIGSILAISDEAGNKLEQRHFDAWGNFTHLKIGNGAIITDKSIIDNASLLVDRGYTSHEHFAEVGIIHMNGRLYDPLLRRFLNADENIQDPYNTQNYNKYGYVLNNPLMFNDPSGEFFQFLMIPIVQAIAIAVVGYTATVLITGGKFNILNLYSSIVMGMISAGITIVIGDVFSTATASIGNEALRSLVHAGVQGTLSFMQGGNFFTAAASAFLSSAVSFGYGQAVGAAAYSGTSQFALGMLSGGVGHALAGGNFWEGVKIGGIVALFNHVMHRIEYRDKLTQFLTDNGVDPRAKATNETLTKYKEIFKEYWNNSAQWAEFANEETIKQWEDSTNKIALNKNGSFITEKGPADGLTNDRSGRVLLSTRLFSKTNWYLADRFIHEQTHSIDIISGFAKSLWGYPIENDIIEFRAYDTVRKWTGTLNPIGARHLLNITNFYINNFK
jgi:RHS repeat-associated protein